MVDVKKLREKIIEIFRKYPSYRDDDLKLISYIWYYQLKKMNYDPDKITAMQFLKLHSEDKIANSESITRCRRKIQEDIPELRGKLWKPRHRNENKIKGDLGYGR